MVREDVRRRVVVINQGAIQDGFDVATTRRFGQRMAIASYYRRRSGGFR